MLALFPLTVAYVQLKAHSEGQVPNIDKTLSSFLMPHKMFVNSNMPKCFCTFTKLSFKTLFLHTELFNGSIPTCVLETILSDSTGHDEIVYSFITIY